MRCRHQPSSEEEAESARRRLAFQELLVLQLRLLLQRNDIQCAALHPFPALTCNIFHPQRALLNMQAIPPVLVVTCSALLRAARNTRITNCSCEALHRCRRCYTGSAFQ